MLKKKKNRLTSVCYNKNIIKHQSFSIALALQGGVAFPECSFKYNSNKLLPVSVINISSMRAIRFEPDT